MAEHTLEDVGVHARESASAHPRRPARGRRAGPGHLSNAAVFVLSIVSALLLWELVSRTGLIDERDLPPMTRTVSELGSLASTSAFWSAFAHTA